MNYSLLATLAGLMFCATMPAATDVTGKWSGFPIYLTLKQDGNMVTGSAGESLDDQIPFEGGTIDENRLNIKFGLAQIELVVDGDLMTGEVHQGTNVNKMIFKRIKPRDPAAPPPAFDAATVKRAPPSPLGKGNSSNMHAAPGRVTATNVPLKHLIVSAWGLKEYQVTAPDWMQDERYDLTGTMPAGTPTYEVLQMLQGLLTERFRLEMHRETKELSVYALVVDKGGLKLKPAEGFGSSVSSSPKGRTMHANATMKSFAGTLSSLVDRPVVDMTGQTGGFSINLEWTADDLNNSKPNEGGAPESTVGPTIFTALHEVGLKLEARKAPVEVLIIDRGEKIPAEN